MRSNVLFAAAAASDDRQELTRRHVQVEFAQDPQFPEVAAQATRGHRHAAARRGVGLQGLEGSFGRRLHDGAHACVPFVWKAGFH